MSKKFQFLTGGLYLLALVHALVWSILRVNIGDFVSELPTFSFIIMCLACDFSYI